MKQGRIASQIRRTIDVKNHNDSEVDHAEQMKHQNWKDLETLTRTLLCIRAGLAKDDHEEGEEVGDDGDGGEASDVG